tara:strand:- start:6972 stop:8111 length:1140 start_codon:yes stop_codon:yes gene_type:complete
MIPVNKNLITIMLIGVLISCQNSNKESNSIKELKNEKETLIRQIDSLGKRLSSVESKISKFSSVDQLTNVTAIQLEEKEFRHYLEVQGIIKADQSVEIYPERNGTVKKIYVSEGDKVSKGQTLLKIDSSVIEASIAELKTQLDLAVTTFNRQERLWRKKIGSEIEFLNAKAKKEGLENSLKSLKAQADKLQIISPFDGKVDEIFLKQGGVANPMVKAVRIINLDKVHVEIEVTESYLEYIKVGSIVELFFPSVNKNLSAKVNQIGNYINPENRSFKVRVDIENKDNTLKANLLADVKINDFEKTGIVIPNALIQKDGSGKLFVYTLNKNSGSYIVEKTVIHQERSYNNESLISKGLTVGSILVDKGSRLVSVGEKVLIK